MSRDVGYVLLLLASTILNYLGGLWIDNAKTKRLTILRVSISINILILGFFKYYLFAFETLQNIGSLLHIHSPLPYIYIILPLGISFYTFQAIAYLVDVYKKKIPAEKHIGRFALFISFFPQLIAGPIERAIHLLPQFQKHITFNRQNIGQGLHLFIRGMFKKVVIADRLGFFVDHVYANPEQFGTYYLWIATIFFGFQIYCDFSGYSDMAIGLAKMLGFDLMKNFKKPYLATNVSNFRKQRHISLSTWLKDYIYIPLGGNRVMKRRQYYNFMVTFLISGLRHGAAWTFVIWGGLHGIYLVIYHMTRKRRRRYRTSENGLSLFLATLITFFFVTIARVFFRANDINQSFVILQQLFTYKIPQISFFGGAKLTIGSFIFVSSMIVVLMSIEIADRYGQLKTYIFRHRPLHISLLIIIIMIIMIFGIFDGQQFIYFQF